jgi:hypothetical protein
VITSYRVQNGLAVLLIIGSAIGAFSCYVTLRTPPGVFHRAQFWPVRSPDGHITILPPAGRIPENSVANAAVFVETLPVAGWRGLFYYRIRVQSSVHWWPDKLPQVDVSPLLMAEGEKVAGRLIADASEGLLAAPTLAEIRQGEAFYPGNVARCSTMVAFILTGILGCGWLRRSVRGFFRLEEGRCVACGYEIPMATERCPECGAIFKPYQLRIAAEVHAGSKAPVSTVNPPSPEA